MRASISTFSPRPARAEIFAGTRAQAVRSNRPSSFSGMKRVLEAGMGLTAAVRTGPGHQRVVRSFDPAAEETLFFPRLVGG
jgi:hypothetical protein